MELLNHRDLRDVLYITRVALACDTLDELRKEVLYSLERVFDCDKGIFISKRGLYGELDLTGAVFHGFDKEFLSRYIHHYRKLDPYVQKKWPAIPNVFTLESVISPWNLLASEYYNNFLKPQGIRYILNLAFNSKRGLLGGVGLFRPEYSKNFSAREKAKAEFMAPYLIGIMEEKMLTHHFMRWMKLFESLAMDKPLKGIIVLDQFLEPLYVSDEANALVASMCSKNEHFFDCRFQLPEELYRCCEQLQKTADDPGSPGQSQQRIAFTLSGEKEKLSGSIRLIIDDGKPVFLVCIEEGNSWEYLNRNLLKIGLSSRECEVAGLLFEGLAPKEICRKLFISYHTVRSHIRSIYEKLNVHSRTSFVRRIAGLN